MGRSIKIVVLLLAIAMVLPGNAQGREKDNLYGRLSSMDVVKVYVEEPKNLSGNEQVDLKGLKEAMDNALETRLTIDFELINDKAVADIIIGWEVKEFFWTDKDPLDMPTTAGVIIDAMQTENYARMQCLFTVKNAKKDKIIWKDKLKATITSKTMTQQESIAMVNERIVKIFMRDCFNK